MYIILKNDEVIETSFIVFTGDRISWEVAIEDDRWQAEYSEVHSITDEKPIKI